MTLQQFQLFLELKVAQIQFIDRVLCSCATEAGTRSANCVEDCGVSAGAVQEHVDTKNASDDFVCAAEESRDNGLIEEDVKEQIFDYQGWSGCRHLGRRRCEHAATSFSSSGVPQISLSTVSMAVLAVMKGLFFYVFTEFSGLLLTELSAGGLLDGEQFLVVEGSGVAGTPGV